VWNDPTNSVPSDMMAKLIGGMNMLHKLMVQNLPPEQLETVFCHIAVSLSSKIPLVFSQVPVSSLSTVGKDRCVRLPGKVLPPWLGALSACMPACPPSPTAPSLGRLWLLS
jgi:hypothetical protein